MTTEEQLKLAKQIDLHSMVKFDLGLAYPFSMSRIAFRYNADDQFKMGLMLLPGGCLGLDIVSAGGVVAKAIAQQLAGIPMLAISYVTKACLSTSQDGMKSSVLAVGMSADGRMVGSYAYIDSKPCNKLVPSDFSCGESPTDPLMEAIVRPWQKDGLFGLRTPGHVAVSAAYLPSPN